MYRNLLVSCGVLALAGSAVLAAAGPARAAGPRSIYGTTLPNPQYTSSYQSNRFYNDQYRFYPYTSGGYAPRDYYQGYQSYYGNGYHPYYNYGYHPYYGYGTNLTSPYYTSAGNYGYYPSLAQEMAPSNAMGRRRVPSQPPVTRAAPADDTARITVSVPEGADVWFDGHKTRATGTVRVFETPELATGKRYGYTVRARWEGDGRDVTQTQNVVVTPGADLQIAFPK
jgi:uncharacterized protein (TIGR03000 family)